MPFGHEYPKGHKYPSDACPSAMNTSPAINERMGRRFEGLIG